MSERALLKATGLRTRPPTRRCGGARRTPTRRRAVGSVACAQSPVEWNVVRRAEMLAQPCLVGGDVEQRCGAREVGIAGGDRVVDARVLVTSEVERTAVHDPVPQTRPNGARREAAQQGAQDTVA